MSTSDAEAFLQRLETDEAFAGQMRDVSGDTDATHRLAVAAGFDFSSEEMLEAIGNFYGVELTHEQLEQIAAGADSLGITLGASVTDPLFGTVVFAAAGG